jgi:hypothetical protein
VRRLLLPLLVLPLALAGCSGGDDDTPARTADPTSSPTAEASAADELTARILEGDEAPAVLASASGELPLTTGGSAPVTVEVLEVRAAEQSTLLRWRLRSGSGQRENVYTSALSLPSRFDTRGIALVDPAGAQRLQPYTYVPQAGQAAILCACSELPATVGTTGTLMYALYPPLDPAARTVDVQVPGLPAVEGVRVTR